VAVLGFTFWGPVAGVVIIAAGEGTDLYCHSEQPLTSGKLCFIIHFIRGYREWAEFLLRGGRPPGPPFEPLLRTMTKEVISFSRKKYRVTSSLTRPIL